jgi:hypothetical protein
MLAEAFSSNLCIVQGVLKVGINLICVLLVARKINKILIYAENPTYNGSQRPVERIMNV